MKFEFHAIPKHLNQDVISEQMAVNDALGALKQGKFNEKAAEVEAQVRAEFRAKLKLEKERQSEQAED
jgi:hypothetical protein